MQAIAKTLILKKHTISIRRKQFLPFLLHFPSDEISLPFQLTSYHRPRISAICEVINKIVHSL